MEKYLYIYSEETVMGEETVSVPFPGGLGTDPFEIADFTYSVSRHGVPMISATIKAPYSLLGKWNHRQFVTFRGVRYNIDEIPTLKRSNTNEYEQYELQMYPEWNVVTKTYFYDVVDSSVSDSSEKYFSNSTNVTFYGTLGEFISRLKASFKKSGIGYDVVIRNSTIADKTLLDEVKEYSGEDMTLLDALKKAFEVWGVPFYYDGGTFVFGFYKNDLDIAVQYGQDKELLSVEKSNAHANIITRATGVGSEQNIPHYYPNETEKGDIEFAFKDSDGKQLEENVDNVRVVTNTNGNSYTVTDNFVIVDRNKLINNVVEGATYQYMPHVEMITLDLLKAEYKLDDGGNNVQWIEDKDIEQSESTTGKMFVQNTFKIDAQHSNDILTLGLRIYFRVSDAGEFMLEFEDEGWHLFSMADFPIKRLVRCNYVEVVDGTFIFTDYEIKFPTFNNITQKDYVMQEWIGDYDVLKIEHVTSSHYVYCLELDGLDLKYLMDNFPNIVENGTAHIDCETLLREYKNPVLQYYWYEMRDYNSNIADKQAPFKKLRDIGVAFDEKAKDTVGYTFSASVVSYQPYQTRLMPSIFTRGKAFNGSVGSGEVDVERYYDATNGLYPDGNGSFIEYPTPYNGKNRSEKRYEYDDIKPEIKGVVNADGQLVGEIADVAYDYDDDDYTKAEGTDSGNYKHPYFYVRLNKTDSPNDMGFNLFDYALADEPMTLQITSGALAGCSFKVQAVEVESNVFRNPVITDEEGKLKTMTVDGKEEISYISCISSNPTEFVAAQQDTKSNSVWIALLKEDSTFGVIMPNVTNGFKLKAGDTFNIININLPKEYILQAEQRLDAAIVRDMQTDNTERFNFAIDFSRIFLAEDYDENELKEKAGIYSTLDDASRIMVYTGDKDSQGNELWVYQYVESYTYECKASEMLPKISLSLVNDIVNKESLAETIKQGATQTNNLWRQAIGNAQNVLQTGTKLADYGITDAYISDDGEIVIGNRSVKPITSYGGSRGEGGAIPTESIWAELTKIDYNKVIDDSHISENIARRDDLKWRNVTEN